MRNPFTPFHLSLLAAAAAAVFAGKAWGLIPGVVVGIVAGKAADEALRPRGNVEIGTGEILPVPVGGV